MISVVTTGDFCNTVTVLFLFVKSVFELKNCDHNRLHLIIFVLPILKKKLCATVFTPLIFTLYRAHSLYNPCITFQNIKI